jgi:hypothetical protein
MSNLLHVVRYPLSSVEKDGQLPVIIAYKVPPETAPYLVSSSGSFLWVEEPFPEDLVKAAVREVKNPGVLYREIIEHVTSRSLEYEWGNVCPYSAEGLEVVTDHLHSYSFRDLEILVAVKPQSSLPLWLRTANTGLPVRPASWVAEGQAVVVPRDRGFVGTLGYVRGSKVVAIVHNASRGIGILRSV